jgi:hypothetical protein
LRLLPSITWLLLLLSAWGCTELNEAELPPDLSAGVTYSNDIQPVLERSCVRCHNDTVTNYNVDLSTYDRLQDLVGTVIIPGTADCRFLTRIVSPEDGKMYRYLNDPSEYDLFFRWIVVDSLAF